MVPRKYKVKDVDMVIAVSALVLNAKLKQEFLQTKRSTFTMDYFTQFEAEINAAVQEFLGADNAKELRQSTIALYASQNEALHLAAEMKLQIELDFEDREEEMLNILGFTAYFKLARNKDQEALINLLHQFKANLTPALKAEMIANGTIPADINAMIAKADELKTSDAGQESNKANRPIATEEAIIAFNKIYNKAIVIAKLATKFYKGNESHQNLFSFAKLARTINASPKTASSVPEA